MKVKVKAKESISLNYGEPITLSKGKSAVLDITPEVLEDLKKVPGLQVVSVEGRVRKQVVVLKGGKINTGLLELNLEKGTIAVLEMTEDAYEKLLSQKVIVDYEDWVKEQEEKKSKKGKSK